MISAGDLRDQLVIQAPSQTDEADGSTTVGYTAVATVWGRVKTSGGREFYNAKRVTPELTHEVQIRWRGDVHAGMRFLNGSTVLRIQAVLDPDNRGVELLAFCQELVQ